MNCARFSRGGSIPQAVWIACNSTVLTVFLRFSLVSIPQAVWIACNEYHHSFYLRKQVFQYRKRYGLHAIIGHAPSNEHRSVSIPQAVWIACNVESDVSHPGWCGFNTASGMDCMQFSCGDAPLHEIGVSIPQAVWIACNFLFLKGSDQMNTVSIPQAVWIACNRISYILFAIFLCVSIPQAVWIACNEKLSVEDMIAYGFQYRKRYGLHAIERCDSSCLDETVSIPQAVWIACNTVSRKPWKQ